MHVYFDTNELVSRKDVWPYILKVAIMAGSVLGIADTHPLHTIMCRHVTCPFWKIHTCMHIQTKIHPAPRCYVLSSVSA